MEEKVTFDYNEPIGPVDATQQDVTEMYERYALTDVAYRNAANVAIMAPWAHGHESGMTDREACNRLAKLHEAIEMVRAYRHDVSGAA